MSEKLHQRAAEIRARALERAWRYRQRRHASGGWDRLRWVLASCERAWWIEADLVDRLVAEGFRVEPAGYELAPPRRLVVVPWERALALESSDEASPLPLHLDSRFFDAPGVLLVRFPSAVLAETVG